MDIEMEVTGGPEESGPTHEDLIQAFESAESGEPAPEKAASKEPPAPAAAEPKVAAVAKSATTETEEEDKDLPEIAAVLRAREKAQKIREEAQASASKQTAEIDLDKEETKMALAEAKTAREEAKMAREEAAREYQRLVRLKENPLEAIKELGWGVNDLVEKVAAYGTPAWHAQQQAERDRADLQSTKKTVDDYIANQKVQQEQWQKQQFQSVRQNTLNELLNTHMSSDKAPNARSLYEDDEIVWKADKIYDQIKAATGQAPTLAAIANYIEWQAAQKTAKNPQQASGAATRNGAAPKANAGASRTMSAAAASERRASPKNINELSDQEQRKLLIEEYEAAARGE